MKVSAPMTMPPVDDLFADALQRLADLLGPVSWSAPREQADSRPRRRSAP